LVELYVIQHEGHAIDGALDPIIFNLLASAIQKWWMLKLWGWRQNFHHSMCDFEILYAD
jgi:hypothetical protein